MSGYLVDELRAPALAAIGHRAFQGAVAVGATDMGQRIYITVPAISDHRLGPCRWQARDDTSHPARGDICLVEFDDQGEPWVVAWWPFTT